MYENGWNRFARTGQISDYLTYKGYPATKNKTEMQVNAEMQDYITVTEL